MRVTSVLRCLRQRFRFVREFREFRRLAMECGDDRFDLSWEDRHVCLNDSIGPTGFDLHYFYHLAWAARVLAERPPSKHVDVSSNLRFASIVSAFVPIEFYEYHPPRVFLNNLSVSPGDLLSLPFATGSVSSLSCMHVVEHIGLGRYGDPLNPGADLCAMAELARVLAVGGRLLFVVPVGRPKVQFNAHRIYSFRQVVDGLKCLCLNEFALIPDNAAEAGGLIRNADPGLVAAQGYACGCFLLTKEKQGGQGKEASIHG